MNTQNQTTNAATNTDQTTATPETKQKINSTLLYHDRRIQLHVRDLCEMLKIEYTPERTFTVNDLMEATQNASDACLLLESIVNEKVTHVEYDNCHAWLDGAFIWKSSKPYASDIVFVLHGDSELHYDENGFFRNPLQPRSCPLLETALIDVDLDSESVTTLWGRSYSVSTDEESQREYYYLPTRAEQATDALFISSWGGPNSQTRGLSDSEMRRAGIELGIEHCHVQRCKSKAGREGVDYLIVDFLADDEAAGLAREYGEVAQSIAETLEDMYAEKVTLVDGFYQEFSAVKASLEEINTELERLVDLCTESPALEKPFVEVPEIELIPTNPPAVTTMMPLEDLQSMQGWSEMRLRSHRNYLLDMEVIVEAWLKYAPRYLELEPLVRSLGGSMMIDGLEATVALTSQDSKLGCSEKGYVFSEEGVNACLNDLAAYRRSEKELAEVNRRMLALQLKLQDEEAGSVPVRRKHSTR